MVHSAINDRNSWEFVYNGSTVEYPLGYYYHKPTSKKTGFEEGILDKVSKEDEQYIYDMWWVNNG